MLLWQGASGQQVPGTSKGLSESQARIEQVAGRIETTQIGLAGNLGTLTSLSMAALGVTSMAAGFMVWRMHALHNRLNALGDQLSDIQANLKAQDQAHLEASLKFLGRFEQTRSEKDLHAALEEATFATGLYRGLVQREVHGPRRLLLLNECGRYYLLALTAQTRCRFLDNQLARADQEVSSEKPALSTLVRTTFEEVMGKTPEVYLDPKL